MKEYLIPFAFYIFTIPVLDAVVKDPVLGYALKFILTLAAAAYFYKAYRIRWKISFISLAAGVIIFAVWVLSEGHYPQIPGAAADASVFTGWFLVLRFIGSITIAPFVEEVFVRDFLNRFVISKDWKKVPVGRFTALSFIFTVLFFGLSHNRWLPGLISGVVLNLVLMRQKSISECIFAHFIANLFLSTYVVATGAYMFW